MISEAFTTFIYQPFFNVLVFFYWVLDQVNGSDAADMGVAVILLTILIRVLLLPLSFAGDKTEKDRRDIALKVHEIEVHYASDPITMRKQRQKVLKTSTGVLIAELFNLFVQVAIALMLWRIFARGLEGEDLHLLYSFMPKVQEPFNLVFLGKYDLAHTNFFLNLLQSFSILVLETVRIVTSEFKHERAEVVRLQLVLPVVSFLVFMALPAGKKLFVITTLWFSVILTIVKYIIRKFEDHRAKVEAEEAAEAAALEAATHPESEKVVVQVK